MEICEAIACYLVEAIVLIFSCFSALDVDFFTLYLPIILKSPVKSATPSITMTTGAATTVNNKPMPPSTPPIKTVSTLSTILAALKYYLLKASLVTTSFSRNFEFCLFFAIDISALGLHRLVWFLEKNKLITTVQSGFRKQRSTLDHLVRYETFIREGFIKKEHVVSVFFDLERAYDTIWKNGIMNGLHDFGIRDRLAYFISVFF